MIYFIIIFFLKNRHSHTIVALEQTTYDVNLSGKEYSDAIRSSLDETALESSSVVPRTKVAVRDYRPCGGDAKERMGAEDARLSGEVAEAILRTFGRLFPYKNV